MTNMTVRINELRRGEQFVRLVGRAGFGQRRFLVRDIEILPDNVARLELWTAAPIGKLVRKYHVRTRAGRKVLLVGGAS